MLRLCNHCVPICLLFGFAFIVGASSQRRHSFYDMTKNTMAKDIHGNEKGTPIAKRRSSISTKHSPSIPVAKRNKNKRFDEDDGCPEEGKDRYNEFFDNDRYDCGEESYKLKMKNKKSSLEVETTSLYDKKSGNKDESDDDYYERLASGLERNKAGDDEQVKRQHRQDVCESESQGPQVYNYGAPGVVFQLSEAWTPSCAPNSLYNSLVTAEQQVRIGEEEAIIYTDYGSSSTSSSWESTFHHRHNRLLSSSKGSIENEQSDGGGGGGATAALDVPSTASPQSSYGLLQRLTSFGFNWPYSPLSLSGGTALAQNEAPPSSVPPPKSKLKRSLRGVPIRRQSPLHVLEQFEIQKQQKNLYKVKLPLLNQDMVNSKVNASRRSSRRATINEGYLNDNEEEVKEFEEVEDRLIQYQQIDGFGEDCLKWYLNRIASNVLPTLEDSTVILSDSCVQQKYYLNDGGTHWFEPHVAFRAKHRLLVIHAIGLQFSIENGKYYVVPIILKNGLVVGFWEDAKESPWPKWRPILSIRMTQSFPLAKNAAELAVEAGFIDDLEIRKRYHEDFGGDLWLERAALELSSLPGGSLPVTVSVPSFAVCMHLMGWRVEETVMNDVDKLALKVCKDEETSFFRSYMIEKSVLIKHLVPIQIKSLLYTSQGKYVASFSGLFDTKKAFNHFLLLPGGNKKWSQQFGNKEIFKLLFDPLIQWLKNPLTPPLVTDFQSLTENNRDGQQCSPYSSPCDSMISMPSSSCVITGSRNKAELPDDFVPIHDQQTKRDYCLISIDTLSTSACPPFSLTRTASTLGSSSSSSSSSSSTTSNPTSLNNSATSGSSSGCSPLVGKQCISDLTLHNPLVDLIALEDGVHFFNDACLANQWNAASGAEIMFSRLVYRCCTILTLSAHEWVNEKYASQAQRNLLKIRTLFLNNVNKLLNMSTNYKWPSYTSWEDMSSMECYLIYHRFVTLTL